MEDAFVYLFEVRLDEGGLAYKVGVSRDVDARESDFKNEAAYPFEPIELVLKQGFPSMNDAESAEDRCQEVLRLLDCKKHLDTDGFDAGETEIYERMAGSLDVSEIVERCLEVQRTFIERGWSSEEKDDQSREGFTGYLFDH